MKTNRKSALIAGIALLIMAITAGLIYGYLHNTLVIPNNPNSTFENLKSNGLLFETEVFGWFFILVLDLIVAWALYSFFKNENKNLSLFTAGLRIVFVVIFSTAVFNFIQVLKILNGNQSVVQESLSQQVMNHINAFESTWSFALIIFGFHLLGLGVLALKSHHIQNIWGILLIFAGLSYSLIHSAKFLLPEFESQIKTVEMILSFPMAFGEVGFAFWLIIRGGKPVTKYKSNYKITLQSQQNNSL